MHRSDVLFCGKAADRAERSAGAGKPALLLAVLAAAGTWLLGACSTGDELMTTVALAPEETPGSPIGQSAPAVPEGDLQSGKLEVTPAQQSYLDALSAAGVHPSSDLRALSIGSSICQARAAGQSSDAVWDYVAPLVRSDVADAHETTLQPVPGPPAEDVTADYIRIATERLC